MSSPDVSGARDLRSSFGSPLRQRFAVPSFGIKIDAVPGRLNETWFNARETGLYYGQCSELCGKDHAYMPIAVRVVSAEEYQAFITALQESRDYATAVAVLPAIQ